MIGRSLADALEDMRARNEFSFKVTYTPVRRGSMLYLQERIGSSLTPCFEYGPICPLLVDAFVREEHARIDKMVAATSHMLLQP